MVLGDICGGVWECVEMISEGQNTEFCGSQKGSELNYHHGRNLLCSLTE
jgi:hypothetical protein